MESLHASDGTGVRASKARRRSVHRVLMVVVEQFLE